MATVETLLRSAILANTTASGLVGTRVYPQTAPTSATLPFVTYTKISGGPLNAIEAPTTTYEARFQVDVYASTYGGTKTLAAAVEDALSGYSDATSTPCITSVHLDNEQDSIEPLEGGAEEGTHRIVQDYIVWYG